MDREEKEERERSNKGGPQSTGSQYKLPDGNIIDVCAYSLMHVLVYHCAYKLSIVFSIDLEFESNSVIGAVDDKSMYEARKRTRYDVFWQFA